MTVCFTDCNYLPQYSTSKISQNLHHLVAF